MFRYLKLSIILILSFIACSQDNEVELNQSEDLFEIMFYDSGEISTQNHDISMIHTQLQCALAGSNFPSLFETDTSFFFKMDTHCCYIDSVYFDKDYIAYENGIELATFSISTSPGTITDTNSFDCEIIEAYTNQLNNSIMFDGEKVLLKIYN